MTSGGACLPISGLQCSKRTNRELRNMSLHRVNEIAYQEISTRQSLSNAILKYDLESQAVPYEYVECPSIILRFVYL